MYDHLELTSHQLRHLLNELNSRSELYWLSKALKIPLRPSQVRRFKLYKQLSWLIHKLKPQFPEWLQEWLAIYFTVIFEDGFESGDFSAWTGTAGAPAVVSTTSPVSYTHLTLPTKA